MNRLFRGHLRLILLGIAIGTLNSGCQQKSDNPFARYIAPPESAKAAITRVLEGWLQGLPPEQSGSKQPEVHVVDQMRKADQRLERYEVLGEVPVDNARAFAVRVYFKGSDEPEIIRYIALGVEPMWIFRREDYEGIWQHSEEAPADRAGEPAKKP